MGSNVSAGGKLSITATGKNKDNANRGNINATASHFNANDIEFNAPGDINLNAGYKTTESKATSSSNSFGVGASVDVGIEGGSASLTGNMSLSNGKTTSSSKTAMDTVVNGKNSVTINNGGGHLTLHGAEITNKNDDGSASNGKVAINTGSVTITTPQNTSKYDSDSHKMGIGASTPIAGFGWNSPNNAPDTPYTQDTVSGAITSIHNDYASTEKTMSGIYAGKGGLTIDVTGKTQLNGGAISSEADASKNHMNTGSLEANSIQNHSKWSGLNINGSETTKNQNTLNGTATASKNNHPLPGSVVNTAEGPNFSGNVTSHDGHSTTNSAIGGNITVNAGSTTGVVANDVQGANGYLEDRFNAGKIQSDFKKQNQVSQIIDKVTSKLVNKFFPKDDVNKDNKPKTILGMTSNSAAHMVSSGISSITGAILGNGDVGATVAGTVGGDLINITLPNIGKDVANIIAPDKKNPLDPKNGGRANGGQGKSDIGQGDITQNKSDQSVKNPTYDTVTDTNKIVSGIAQDIISGGVGAITGIITGGGNIGIDATAGGLTSLKQSPPKIVKPKDPKVDPKKVIHSQTTGKTLNATKP